MDGVESTVVANADRLILNLLRYVSSFIMRSLLPQYFLCGNMIDQFFLKHDCQIGSRPLYQNGNNRVMNKSPIRLAKQLSGLSGEKLAEELGISPAHLSRMGTKKRRITTETIEKLAAICGKSPDQFYQLLGTDPLAVEEAAEALTSHPVDEPLMLDPDLFKKAYDRAKHIEQTMLGGRGSNSDFAVILEQTYNELTENGDK